MPTLAKRAFLLASIALFVAGSSGGCAAEQPACYEGDHRGCSCGEAWGYQRCEGGAYGACDCRSVTPGLGGSRGDAGGGEGGSALLPFLAPCDQDAQCETGLCFSFIAKGPRCTQPCGDEGDCPPPSTGCNMMGVCKAP